ncbi:site-specific DNA-methyltransferase [bacterium]|nr:site-specific DNA-methyltransferase [candidate division CSSED10-310 bacterium]
MRLDDVESADAPAVESYLLKIKVLRKIARQLIDFLAQLEDFQKKLWLKKKFVVETNYCVTLDRIPEELYPEIAANEAQRNEWVDLFAIHEIKGDLVTPRYSEPLTVPFLKANANLVLDTKFFPGDFKARLLASLHWFDDQCDGVLVHSENFQALKLLGSRYREQVKCVYIDPPYNTGGDEFLYKDNFRHSTWMTFISSLLLISSEMLRSDGLHYVSIDDTENHNLKCVFDNLSGAENFIACIIWKKNFAPRNTAMYYSENHDYILCYAKDASFFNIGLLPRSEAATSRYKNPDNDSRGPWTSGDLTARNYYSQGTYEVKGPSGKSFFPAIGTYWRVSKLNFKRLNQEGRIWWGETGANMPRLKRYLSEVKEGVTPVTIWSNKEVGDTQEAKKELLSKIIFNQSTDVFNTIKPVRLIERIVLTCKFESNDIMIDYFGGSGSTADAIIKMNKKDSGKRKYILIEMGNHFNAVMKTRISKSVYSTDWKDGKPTSRNTGISHCFKYFRLESYEDTLNNLRFKDDAARDGLLAASGSLRRDYMLNYMLDVETKGSGSLLNIDGFQEPAQYRLNIKNPGGDEYEDRAVDLLETFNYLIGLRVVHMDAPARFTAWFNREKDPELPDDQETRLEVVDMRKDDDGPWWFRKIEGWLPADPENPNNGLREKVLVVWRNLPETVRLRGTNEEHTGLEYDNAMLDQWFGRNRLDTRDFEFDTIYVNGGNNLPNLRREGETWKVRLIEEDFMRLMWDVEDL